MDDAGTKIVEKSSISDCASLSTTHRSNKTVVELVAENTRAAYPIEYIPNAKLPCVGPHPKNVILLACDAFGVLPPVSKLSLAQTMYHFISGYTALVNLSNKF